MTRGPWLVARTEVRRSIRAVTDDRTKLFLLSLLGLFMGGSILISGGYLLPRLGAELAAGATEAEATLATELVTGGLAIGWLFVVFIAAIRTFSANDPEKPAFLLVSSSVRTAAVGIVTARTVLFGLWTIPPAIALAGAFAYGAETIVPVLLAPIVVSLVLLTAVPAGFVLGTWLRHLVTVYEPIARYRIPLFVGFWVAYFGAIATGHIGPFTSWLFRTLQGSPLGWPGHLLLVGVPSVPPSTGPILGALLGTILLGAVGLVGAIGAARTHWFADRAQFDDRTASDTGESSRLVALLDRVLSRPVRTVTVTAIRRTKRAPIRLAYVGYPLLGALGFVQQIVETGRVPAYVAVVLSIYVVWAGGALFTLNPVGDLGRGLPAVVASPLSGRQATAGLVIAGAIVAAPIGFVGSLALGLASPLSPDQIAVLVAATTTGAIVTPALATGIGTAAPRFGSVSITNNREAVMPSKTAFLIYSMGVLAPAAAAVVLYTDSPGLLAELFVATAAVVPSPEVSITAGEITIAAWTVLAIGLVAPIVSAFYAIEQFDLYTIE